MRMKLLILEGDLSDVLIITMQINISLNFHLDMMVRPYSPVINGGDFFHPCQPLGGCRKNSFS
ncbi:hypothetical protein D3C86_1346460 [compost metagenome]